MEMADHLEGLKSQEQMIPAAMAAILRDRRRPCAS
jgi:hypothetical protein